MPETKTLAHYEKLKYPIEILEDDDAYVASIPDLPGCVAYGNTIEQAMESLRIVKKLWIEGRLEAGLAVPEPAELEEYSGKFVLRISRGLHKSLQREARRQGISLNQYAAQILAERHKLVDLEHTVRDAVSHCLRTSCQSPGLYWNVENPLVAHPIVVKEASWSTKQFTEVFGAPVGGRVCKSYHITLADQSKANYRTTDATRKEKAR